MDTSLKKEHITSQAPGNTFGLVVIRSKLEKIFFQNFYYIIPVVYLFRGFLQFIDTWSFPSAFQDFVKIPAEIALILALIFANSLFAAIPKRFHQLFTSNVLLSSKSINTQKESFIKNYDYWLNHKSRKIIGFSTAILIFLYYILRIGGPQILLFRAGFSLEFIDYLLYIFPSVFYSYFVGIIVWKLFVSSYFIATIPIFFRINVQFVHPDGAGGLLPVGKLCLNMIYVTVIPTILSALLLITPLIGQSIDLINVIPNRVLLFGLAPMILFFGISGSVVALIPAIKFHKIMLEQKPDFVNYLNDVSKEIVLIKKKLISDSQSDDEHSIENLQKRLSFLESFYKSHQSINTWPMNRQILIKVWSTQTFLFAQVLALWNWINKVL